MKEAELKDVWRHLSKRKGYLLVLDEFSIQGVNAYDNFTIQISSALTAICGRNGIGKSTLLKLLYLVLTNNNLGLGLLENDNIENVEVRLTREGQAKVLKSSDANSIPNVEYFDSSTFALNIINTYNGDNDTDSWFDGELEQSFPKDLLDWLKKITGKPYTSVSFYEVSILESEPFPFFKVELDGASYCSNHMGQGEHKIFVILWKMFSIEPNSIVFLEEPETFICPSSQINLMDFLAVALLDKKTHVILSTHSDHVLEKIKLDSINILRRSSPQRFEVIKTINKVKYLQELELAPEKKTIYLVEDAFAKSVLEVILHQYAPDLLLTSYIHILKGESNIRQVSKHYKGIHGVEIIAVYDRDQILVDDGFISEIPKVFLPSCVICSPEAEVIDYLRKYPEQYAEKLQVDTNKVNTALYKIHTDPHDFFIALSQTSDFNHLDINELKKNAIRIWSSNNNKIISSFLFELINAGKKFKVTLERNKLNELKCKTGDYEHELLNEIQDHNDGTYDAELKHDYKEGKIVTYLRS